MQVLPLIGGAYSARSVVANGQRCINLFPEPNRKDSPSPVTHYQRPGLSPLVVPGTPGPGRCVYQASNGDGYIVVGSTIYFVDSTWTLHNVGSVAGSQTTPCSMIDNGIQVVLVNGFPFAGNVGGNISFSVNPTAGDTITLNTVVWTFIAGPSSGTNVQIGGTLGFTMANLLNALNASTNPLITAAVYGVVTSGGNQLLTVLSKTPGAAGSSYTLAASAATPSGANLSYSYFPPPSFNSGYYASLGSMAPSSFNVITDPAWTGADRVDYIDTFVVWNQPGTAKFGSTLSNQIVPLDSTYVASKTGYPDRLQSLIVNRRELVLLGSFKTEIWYDAGNANFPFAELPGLYVEHGLVARYSLASADLNVYWLSQDLQGQGIVLRLRGNEAKRISNYALEFALRQMYAQGVAISDAVGYTYQQDGHLFYVLSFPSGNQTWVWDESIGEAEYGWSQRAWTDANGVLNRDRGMLGAVLYGKNVVLDWQNGTLYEQKLDTYVDTVTISGATQDYPITYLRTFPHLMMGKDPRTGQPQLANGHMVRHDRFAIDADLGNVPAGTEPQFSLRWSDDRGHSWGNPVLLVAGKQGEFGTRPDLRTLGTAMDRVYELSWNFPGLVALNGAWVEGEVLGQ